LLGSESGTPEAVARDHAPARERFDDEERGLVTSVTPLAARELRKC